MTKKEKRKLVVEALKEFKEKNPYKDKILERKKKFLWLNQKLNQIYGRKVRLGFDIPKRFRKWSFSGMSSATRHKPYTIILRGRLSVITFLHEWGHYLRGSNQIKAQKYAISLFKEVFPERYKKLVSRGGSYALIKKKKMAQRDKEIFPTFRRVLLS